MATLAEKIRNPHSEAAFRLPALILRADAAVRFAALMKVTNMAATKLAAQILEHTLESDPGIRKLLAEVESAQDIPDLLSGDLTRPVV